MQEPRLEPSDVRTFKEPIIGEDVIHDKATPEVKVVVEGAVGSGKTSVLCLLYLLLKEKGIEVKVEDEYTRQEMNLDMGQAEKLLKMYSPTVVLQEKITPVHRPALVPAVQPV